MTFQEFDNTRFYSGIMVTYDDGEYWVRAVNFKERLFGLLPYFLSIEDVKNAPESAIEWVRCEGCALLNKEQEVKECDASKADSSNQS